MTSVLFPKQKRPLRHDKAATFLLLSIFWSVALSITSVSTSLAQEAQTSIAQQRSLIELDDETKNSIEDNNEVSAMPTESLIQNSCSVDGSSQIIWQLSNATRDKKQKCGASRRRPAPELKYDCELAAMAKHHALDLSRRNVLSHTSENGDDMTARANKLGIAWLSLGENIASGHKTPQAAHDAWLNSPGHCKNMMNPDFNSIGVALEDRTWVVVFAKKK